MNERDFPHFVDIDVPSNGLGTRLEAMYEWHRQLRLDRKAGSGGRDVARFCFLNAETADAFHNEFGGERKSAEPKRARGR